jgi:hypothetical protein
MNEMMTQIGEVKLGDRVLQQMWSGGWRWVEISRLEENVKNGRAGFDGLEVKIDGSLGQGVWGYLDQICGIEPRSEELQNADLGGSGAI